MNNIVTYQYKLFPLLTKHLIIDRKWEFKDGVVSVFTDEEYKELEKEKVFQEGLALGYFSVIKAKDADKVASKRNSPKKIEISKLSLEEAKILSASENDKTKLKNWLREEKENQNREEVIAVLEANLKTGLNL